MNKKRNCLLMIFSGLVILILVVVCWQWKNGISSNTISVKECEYQYDSKSLWPSLCYPQITGYGDIEKEDRINRLIKYGLQNDIKKIMDRYLPDPYERPVDIIIDHDDYEIKYIGQNLISIAYYVWYGSDMPGTGLNHSVAATTIDIEKERVLELSDVVDDFDTLQEELWNDRFEHITMWDGDTGWDKISKDYYGEEGLREALLNGDVEWYIEGKNFVFVSLEGKYYNEYARKISSIQGIFQDDFLKILGDMPTLQSEEERMPAMVDVIITENNTVFLCKDGSVWEKQDDAVKKISGLRDVVKVMELGIESYSEPIRMEGLSDIIEIYQSGLMEGMELKLINLFESDRQEHWLKKIQYCEWSAGAFLYGLISNGTFFDAVGEGSKVLLLTDGDELLSFCTYAKKDDIQPTELTPWMGFVYTFPNYRGHHYVGMLFEEIEHIAKEDGTPAVFISTNHIGLYEKYGCEFLAQMKDMHGELSRVYVKRFV